MGKVFDDISELIGDTPLISLDNIGKGLNGNLIAKVESFNPLGSVKDRIAYQMIEDAEKIGDLTENTTIVEPTRGNTGIGLSYITAIKGYDLILTMPENMSIERKKILRIFGTELIWTDEKKGMKGAVRKAEELLDKSEDHIMLKQFTNPSNPKAHRTKTAEEIWKDTEGNIDCFIAGIGTGGTITGVGEKLKEKDENITVIGIEPSKSPVLSEGKSGTHKIQGIGAGFVPEIINLDILDEVIKVNDEDALTMSRELARKEGILAGLSSGAVVSAGIKVANRKEFKDKNIIMNLPNTGERYISTELFENLD
ncbi:MAG: cysteine synthase A [Thermoplasmatota archaeon]